MNAPTRPRPRSAFLFLSFLYFFLFEQQADVFKESSKLLCLRKFAFFRLLFSSRIQFRMRCADLYAIY